MMRKILFLFGLFSYFSFNLLATKESTFVIGSIGDSVTTANNARSWGDNEGTNWSTGHIDRYGVKSHYQRLTSFLKNQEVIAVNVAASGSTSADIGLQVDALLQNNPNYVTLLVGGNDACSWSSNYERNLDVFKTRIENAIVKLINHNFAIKILLVSVPDMYHLWQLGRNDCGWLWDLSGACPDLLSSSSTASDRSSFVKRLNEINNTFIELQQKYSTHVKHDASVASYKFEKEDVSTKDCFHPSLKGQSKLAEITWGHSWFSKPLRD